MSDLLDCGHVASPHGEHTTGYGTLPDGTNHCWDCCTAQDLASIAKGEKFVGYLDLEGRSFGGKVTNWPGRELLRVTAYTKYQAWGFGGYHTMYSVRAVDRDGRQWWGRGPGPGMYIRMYPSRKGGRRV